MFETLDGTELQLTDGPDELFVASGAAAHRLYGDLNELHALRLKRAGGSVYPRRGSPYWQIKYFANGKWQQETTRTKSKRDAYALLREGLLRERWNAARHRNLRASDGCAVPPQ